MSNRTTNHDYGLCPECGSPTAVWFAAGTINCTDPTCVNAQVTTIHEWTKGNTKMKARLIIEDGDGTKREFVVDCVDYSTNRYAEGSTKFACEGNLVKEIIHPTGMSYINKKTGEVRGPMSLTEADRFLDNRDPDEWEFTH